MSQDVVRSGGGLGFLNILTLIFIVLKLTGNIDWSWWWVLSPLWIPLAIIVVGCIFILYFIDKKE